MKICCVLDLDETLGYFDAHANQFMFRPYAETLIMVLYHASIDIILWSYGSDEYVKYVINHDFPVLKRYAFKIFARTQCLYSHSHYNVMKWSRVIQTVYPNTESIFLICVDDKVNLMMDPEYSVRICVEPYVKINSVDQELADVISKIFHMLHQILK